MSFAVRTHQGGNLIPATQSPNVGVANTALTTGIRSGSFTLKADGSSTKTPSGSGSISNWLQSVATGNGANYWVKFTVNSTNNTSITGESTGTSGWLAMSADRTWNFANTGATLEGFGTFTLQFALDSAGSNIAATYSSQNWDVGYTP